MSKLEQWLEYSFDRRVRVFPSNMLRCEYVEYLPKNGGATRFPADAHRRFSLRRVSVAVTASVIATVPWLLPVVYLWG